MPSIKDVFKWALPLTEKEKKRNLGKCSINS